MLDIAQNLVSDQWKQFSSSSSSSSTLQDTFSDELHSAFVVHFVSEHPIHKMSPNFTTTAQQQKDDDDDDPCVGPSELDAEWALAVSGALTQVILEQEAATVDTRDILMQLQFFAHKTATSGEGTFLSCGSYLDLEADEAAEVWFRSIVLCEFVRSVIEARDAKRQKVVPWVSTALSLLRVDDTVHRMPAAYVSAATELLRTATRVCQEEARSVMEQRLSGPVIPSQSLRSAAPALLCIGLKLKWHHFRCGGTDSVSDVAGLIDACFDLREDVAALLMKQPQLSSDDNKSKPDAKQLCVSRMLQLAAELGVVRVAAHSSSSSSSSSTNAARSSHRGAAPAALQGRFLQAGNLAGALSTGVDREKKKKSNTEEVEAAEADSDPAAANKNRALLLESAQRKDARVRKMRQVDFKFLSSSEDDDDDNNNSTPSSSAEVWRRQQEAALQAADSGCSEGTAKLKAFLQQCTLGCAAAGAASDAASVASQHCCLVEPLVAAGWLVRALELFLHPIPNNSSDDVVAGRHNMLLVLSVFTHAAPCVQQTFDASTISNGIIEKLALGASVPLYSVSCERLPESVRRLKFLGGGGDDDDDDGEISRLLSQKKQQLSAGDAEKRSAIVDSYLDTLREAVVARRSAVGEAIALALQTLVWLVSQPPPPQNQQQQQQEQGQEGSGNKNPPSSPPPMIFVQAMNSLLQRCDENTRFKLVVSLLVLSPHDSFSTTFLGAFRFCIQDDLQLCEKSAGGANNNIARHDLRSPFLDGALLLISLSTAVSEWSRVLKNFWFQMRHESCMTVLQIIGWLRGVDARLKKLSSAAAGASSSSSSSGGIFDWSTDESSRANRRALLCAKECIVDTIGKQVELVKQRQKEKAEEEAATAAVGDSGQEKKQPVGMSSSSELPDLMLHQFDTFVNMATMTLASFG